MLQNFRETKRVIGSEGVLRPVQALAFAVSSCLVAFQVSAVDPAEFHGSWRSVSIDIVGYASANN